jgi:hypothetical protein
MADYFLKLNPTSARALRSGGKVAGPIPWSFDISFSDLLDKCCNVVMPSCCNARLAGADISDRNPVPGLFACSQMGQIGQSLVL